MDPVQDWLFPDCTHTLELPQVKWWREKRLDLTAQDYKRIADRQVIADRYDEKLTRR